MKHQLWRKAAAMLPTLLLSFCTMAQTHVVSGTITDEEQLPIPGANVVIKGTTTGTITAGDGKFTMQASDGDVLQISYIGYTTEEVTVNGSGPYDVSLVPDMVGLSEVVVVGYGTQRKEAVTGSVASMKGDVVREMPGANITQSLQSRIAGVNMQQSSSKPGAEMQIRVRGTRSLNASNDPLIVLDGIPFAGTLGDIDPNSIKSIDILKDASATAIYGSRGANGVILITTSKGSIEQDATIVYSGYYGIKDVFAKYPMMNAEQLKKMRDITTYNWSDMEKEDYARGVDTDWQDLYYDKGMATSHDLSVTGGTKTSAYSFGFGYYREEAVIPLQNYSRFSLRSAVDQKVGKYIKVGYTSNNVYSITNGNSIGVRNILEMSPLVSPTDADGNDRRTVYVNSADSYWTQTRKTLEALGEDFEDKKLSFGTFNSLYAELSVPHVQGLKYRINTGLNLKYVQDGYYRGVGVMNPTDANSLATASLGKSLNLNWAVENLLTYDRTFGAHTINAVGLLSFERSQYHRNYVEGVGIASKKFLYYNLNLLDETNEGSVVTVDPNRQNYNESGLKSAMARLMYSYDDRYMLTVAVRNDKSSRLAKSNNSHTYPAVSVGWNIGRESFMEDFSWLNSMKLRVGYGQTSNQAVEPYQTLGALASRPYNFGDDIYSTGYYVSQLANNSLGWEYSETMNYGVDFAFLDRISGSFEYYVQKTNDVLLRVNLPPTSGVNSYMANIGKTQNKGWEFNVNANILNDYNGFTWDVGFNMYSNKNELIELASGQERDEYNFWFVGHSINSIYDYENIGIWQEDEFNYQPEGWEKPIGKILEGDGGQVGMIRVKYTGDYDEHGKPTREINEKDKQIMEIDPKLIGGFNTRLEYKGFDLTVIGAFQAGGKLISNLHTANSYLNMLNGRRGQVDVDYWTPENTGGKYPYPGSTGGDNRKYASTLGYFSASYCKLRTITLGYNFKNNGIGVLDEIGIKKIRVYATIQNPWVIASKFHKETGLDPETNSFGDENLASTGESFFRSDHVLTVSANTPSTRTYLVGLNITF